MLDKINNNISESIAQSQSLDRIKEIGVSNPFEEEDDKKCFVDESLISESAMKLYQKEVDIKEFSKIFNQIDQKEADELVLQKTFEGKISIDNDEFLSDLIMNEEFLNEITNS